MIILTGGAGFIGSAFLSKLNGESRDDVLVVDEPGTPEKWKNLAGKRFADYLQKDLFIDSLEAGCFPHVDGIIHMGANSSTTERNVEYLMENNYRYTRRLAVWSLRHNVRFIYASSAATYGNGEQGFSDNDDGKLRHLQPLNPYGHSKHIFDLWALDHCVLDKITGIKFFNVFGPNEYHKGEMRSLVCKAYYQIQETGIITLFKSCKPEFTDGGQMRDFVYIKDCIEVLWWLLTTPHVNGIFNLGSGKARSWNDLAHAIFTSLGRAPCIRYIDMPESIRDAYQYFTEASMDKLRRAGCPVTFRPLEDSVTDFIRNYMHPEQRFL